MSDDLPDVPAIDEIATLDQYMARYGALLGRQVRERITPLHTPGVDPLIPVRSMRPPLPAQHHLITANVRLLRREKVADISGAMGTGKTICGMLIADTHAAGKPYRGLVFCPPHLVKKWCRELTMTIPGCTANAVSGWSDLTKLRERPKPTGPEWWVISQNTAKLGPSWEPAFLQRKVYEGSKNKGHIFCPTCARPLEREERDTGIMVPVSKSDLAKKRQECEYCKTYTPLWSWGGKMKRWAGASYVSRQLRGMFDYLIIDEAHQEKGAETAQGNAAGTLISACRKVITLTGTKIGGQADHIRTLSYRLIPHRLVEGGYEWGDYMSFSERYGRIERRVTVKGGSMSTGPDNRNSRGSSGKTVKFVRPGIMPVLFGDILMGNTSFISLQDVSDDLPPLKETLRPIPMDDELAKEYERIEDALTSAVKEMAVKGDKRLLGTMLQTLLCYPDKPFGWKEVGYWGGDEDGERVWNHVVTPANLSEDVLRNKEQELIDDCVAERDEGRQVWVFTTMTDKRDVCERLRIKMMCRGLRTMILRSDDVPPKEREEWIAKWGPQCDVVISHPQLVETGIELFDKGGGHNFATLSWYLTGYNLFTLRQASARHFRIGQMRECRTKYWFYAGTMQERAMTLMGQKLTASQAIEGKFSTEGLVAMAGDDDTMEMALAKNLVDRVSMDATRSWEKITASAMAGGPVTTARPIPAKIELRTPEVVATPRVDCAKKPKPPIYIPFEGKQAVMDFRPEKQLALFG